MVKAWYLDNDEESDQRLPHQTDPPQFVSIEELGTLGVEYFYFHPKSYTLNPEYHRLRVNRAYTYEDKVEVSPDRVEDYESKLRGYFLEHIHYDEEIRYILDGSGYFDVRDLNDKWIRIEVTKGDMIVLPAGIYHRFTLCSKNYIKALRLFIGDPVWTPHLRAELDPDDPCRAKYLADYGRGAPKEAKETPTS